MLTHKNCWTALSMREPCTCKHDAIMISVVINVFVMTNTDDV